MNNNYKKNRKGDFSIIARLKSFRDAFSGLAVMVKFEHNLRIHLFILVAVILAGIFLRISATDWIAIVFASGLVIVSESFNTAIENLSDVISPGYNEKIKIVKDVTAAGVFISAVVSAIIGIIIFLPRIIELLTA